MVRSGFTAHWFLVDWIKSQREGQSAEQLRGKIREEEKKKNNVCHINLEQSRDPWNILDVFLHSVFIDKCMIADKRDRISTHTV